MNPRESVAYRLGLVRVALALAAERATDALTTVAPSTFRDAILETRKNVLAVLSDFDKDVLARPEMGPLHAALVEALEARPERATPARAPKATPKRKAKRRTKRKAKRRALNAVTAPVTEEPPVVVFAPAAKRTKKKPAPPDDFGLASPVVSSAEGAPATWEEFEQKKTRQRAARGGK